MKHTMAYVSLKTPLCCIFEITKKSVYCKPKDGSDSVYDVIVKDMNQCGYVVISQILSADAYGSPQRRDRAWILGFQVSEEAMDQNLREFVPPTWLSQIPSILMALKIPMMPIELFLLRGRIHGSSPRPCRSQPRQPRWLSTR